MPPTSDDTPSLHTLFDQYRHGTDELLRRIGTDHPRYSEGLTYQQQLQENLARELHGPTSTGKAERSQILSHLGALCLDVLRVPFEHLCSLTLPATTPPPSDFVNRDVALRELTADRLRSGKSPYVLITAPAGYGKSYLLHHLRAQLTTMSTWQCHYIDCLADPEQTQAAITQTLMAYSTLAIAPSPTIPDICGAIFQSLTTNNDAPVMLLLFDNIEKLTPGAQDWLHQLLHTLYVRTRLGNRELHTVRVILAGRETAGFWDDYMRRTPRPPVPRRITLPPFDQHAIEDLLWHQATTLHLQDNLEQTIVTQLSAELHYFSSGHPQVTHDLVTELAQHYFAIGPIAAYFAQNHTRWAQICLIPVAQALLQDVPADIAQAARRLSLFRRVNANTVQALVTAQWLPTTSKAIDVLGELVKAQLLQPPHLREPFFKAHRARRVLALEMAYRDAESQTHYHQINQLACDLYARWIRQGLPDPYLGPSQRLLSVVEWLYHALLTPPLDPARLHAELLAYLHILCSSPDSMYVIDLIVNEIRQDTEITYLLHQHLGENGVDEICGNLLAYKS